MEKGEIIYLNGVTSTGKTSIVEALQRRGEMFFYSFSNDLFQEMIGDEYLRRDYWKYLSDAVKMLYHTAKLFSDMGRNVIIDGMITERDQFAPHYEQILAIFSENPLYIIEVSCPLEICRQRNIARGDRGEYQSHDQAKWQNEAVDYTCKVETDKLSPDQCAEQIMNAILDK